MKGEIKIEVIGKMSFDIEKGGTSLALECQSIFMTLVNRNDLDLDSDINMNNATEMMGNMTKDIVMRVKQVFIECIVSPKITSASFEDLPPSTVPALFLAVYFHQVLEADKKKEPLNDSKDSQTNS